MPQSLFDGDGRLTLRGLWRARRGAWLLALAIGLLALLATIGLLALSGWFITAAGLAGVVALGSAYTFNYFTPAAAIRLLAIVRTVGRYGERLASHDAALALLADLRRDVFARLAKRKDARSLRSAQRMHRLTSDIDTLNEWPLALLLPWLWALCLLFVWTLLLLLMAPALLLWTLPSLLLAGVGLPALGLWLGMDLARTQAQGAEARREALLTPLTALTALVQWGRWGQFTQAFIATDHRHGDDVLHAQRCASTLQMLQQLALVAVVMGLLYRGVGLLAGGDLSVAWLLALLLAVFGLAEVLLPLCGKMLALGNSVSARDRLQALLPEGAQVNQGAMLALPHAPLTLTLTQVSARLPQAFTGPHEVNATLRSGEVLIVQGSSGAGKTTLLQALAGELALQQGVIILNQRPYGDYDWTGEIGYLTQYWDVFDLSLAENVRLGNADADDAALWQALEQVGLRAWAQAQPQGLDTPLGEYGAAVSGGQARRIALARLLLKPYALLLLDEPFAGLDVALRQRLYDRLRAHQREGLLVVVSHHALDWGKGAHIMNISS